MVGGNYIWCLFIVVTFIGFEGAKVGDALKSTFGMAKHVRKSLLEDFIVSLTGDCKRFYRIPLFTLCSFPVLSVLYLLR